MSLSNHLKRLYQEFIILQSNGLTQLHCNYPWQHRSFSCSGEPTVRLQSRTRTTVTSCS